MRTPEAGKEKLFAILQRELEKEVDEKVRDQKRQEAFYRTLSLESLTSELRKISPRENANRYRTIKRIHAEKLSSSAPLPGKVYVASKATEHYNQIAK